MKYPINAEEYIAAMRLEFGPDDMAEEAHRKIIPLVNNAYKAGLKGTNGFPLELEEERRTFAETASLPLERVRENFLIAGTIQWANRAYAQGRKDAEGLRGKQ